MSLYGKFSPIPKNGYPDYPKDSPKWEKFYDEQINYCLNGYQVGGDKISGRLYAKLNFTKILILDKNNNKIPTYPYYADGLRELYDNIEDCLNIGENILYVKGREKGFSYDLEQLCLYQTQFIDYSSTLIIFPGGQSPARKNFRLGYQLAYDSMPEALRHRAGITNRPDEMLVYGWREKVGGQDVNKGIQSSLVYRDAVDADVGKSLRAKIIGIEEAGEIKELLRLITTSEANMVEGSKKYGIIIAGGTTNSMKDGYADLREIYFNPAAYKFRKLFCPANKMYWGFVNYQTGESDLVGAKAHLLAERARFREGSSELLIRKQNFPLDEGEAFSFSRQSDFNSEYCSKQIAKILSDKTIQNRIQWGNLYEGKNGKVEFRIEPNGKFEVIVHPDDGKLLNLDVAGVDLYRLGVVEWGDSKGAMVGYRSFQGANKPGNLVLFTYHYRDSDKEVFFKDCYLASRYWNMKLLAERTDEDFFAWFRQHAAAHICLKRKPKLFQNNHNTNLEEYGIYPSEQAKESAKQYAIQEFNKNYENIYSVRLLDELARFGPGVNTDLAMSYIWAVMHSFDSIRILDEYRLKPQKQKAAPRHCVMRDGHIVVVNPTLKPQNVDYSKYINPKFITNERTS